MSLQSLPVKEFCHEINFLLSTQAGGDTDKMLTYNRHCISTNPTIIIISIFDKLFFGRLQHSYIWRQKQYHIWISEWLVIYFTFMNVLIRLMRHNNDEIWNLEIIISSKRYILPNLLIMMYNVMYSIELIHMIFFEYCDTRMTISYLCFSNFPMKKLSELKWIKN